MNAVRKPTRIPRNFVPSSTSRGGHLSIETIDFIPKETTIRPLRDQMIVEPLDVLHSRRLIIPPHSSKLVRGRVLAIGPGHYPNRYDHRDKHKRTKIMAGMVFVPTEVKVGQIVHLDGRNSGKSAFEAFFWGDTYCIHARQEDVAGVECA